MAEADPSFFSVPAHGVAAGLAAVSKRAVVKEGAAPWREPASGTPTGRRVPPEIGLLFGREREVATIVYAGAPLTAKEVETRLSARLSNSAVRSMLNRLVAKGALRRELVGREFIYLPGLTHEDSRTKALRQFAEDYFGGSIRRAALVISKRLRNDFDAGVHEPQQKSG